MSKGLRLTFDDAWLLGGARTAFIDYRGALAEISPIDLGIKAARAAIARTGVKAADIGHTIAGSMAQASFDAYVTPRHIGLYAGAPIEAPAVMIAGVAVPTDTTASATATIASKTPPAILAIASSCILSLMISSWMEPGWISISA